MSWSCERETEPVDGRAGTGRWVWPGFFKREPSKGIGFFAALLVGELVLEVEVPPPSGLRFSPMPVQQLRQQPAPVLLLRLIR